MEKGTYKFGYTGQSDVEKRFKESGYDVDVIFSWWLPYDKVFLAEQLILSVIKKDFYLAEKLDGITEMREFNNDKKDYIRESLYNLRKKYLEKFPEFKVEKPWKLGWKKLYFVKINLYD